MTKRQLRSATLRVEFENGALTEESLKRIRRFARRLARGTKPRSRTLEKFKRSLREGYSAVRWEKQKALRPAGVKAAETRKEKREREAKKSHRRRRGINYYFGAEVFATYLERFFRQFPDRRKPLIVMYDKQLRAYQGFCHPIVGKIRLRRQGRDQELTTLAHELVHLHWPRMRHGKEFDRLTKNYLSVLKGEK